MPTRISIIAARLAAGSAVAYHVAMFALLLIRPELDPSWQPISEYAIGRHGWIMVLAFLASALSYGALSLALVPHVRGATGRIGLVVLLACTIGTVGAGAFVTDPIETPRDALTTTGQLHSVAAGTALVLLPLAALLLNLSLARTYAARSAARRALRLTAGLPLLGLLGFALAMAIAIPSDGRFGPGVNVGWPNRFLLLVYLVWLLTVTWWVVRLSRVAIDSDQSQRADQRTVGVDP